MLPDNIVFSSNASSDLASFLNRKKYSKLAVLTDDNTYLRCYPLINQDLPDHIVLQIRSGEEEKNLDTCTKIWEFLTNGMLDRHACVLILGGGVLGDMGGFCASTYKRGIDFILVPTTLLAQADASIGGKLGIDFNHFKNHIGVFQQPTLTLLYTGFLKSLPAAELRSGFAEVVKHTLIADREMWDKIAALPLISQHWDLLIRHSVEFKAKVTSEDPTEKGLRKILNAGHTIGHALESYLLGTGNRVLHGEAVAAGLIAEAYIANQRGLLDQMSLDQISGFTISIFGRIPIDQEGIDSICRLILQDKKNKNNKILCVLLNGIGSAKWDYEISLADVRNALTFYLSL